jgi:serine/threonine-protein kinase
MPLLVGINQDAIENQVLRLHAVAARSAAERVASALQPLRALAESAARNPLIAANPRSQGSRETLAALMQAQPALAALSVVNAAGEEYIRVQNRSHAEAADRLLQDPRASAFLFARAAGGAYVRIEAPLDGGAGAVRLVADVSELRELTRPEELGTEAMLAVASARDGLVAAADADISLDAFPPGLLQAAESGRVSGAGRYVTAAGRAVLGAHAPVAGSDWFVVSSQPASVAEATANRMKERSALAVLVALSLASLSSWMAWRTLVRPLRSLAAAQRRLAMGPTRTGGANEIEDLGEAFAVLERQVKDRDAVGKVFLGRYQVIEPIGSGGMGTVFKGWDPKLERHVALKTVHLGPTLATDTRRGQLRSLLHEALTVAKFNHRNIVAIYDLEDLGDAAFVAMELVDGTSLDRYLDRRGPLAPRQVVPLAVGVARGLEAAHAQRIVHRDIKPGNILLGRDGAVKIADFGIAGALSLMAVQADMVFGTPGYLPPEGIRGAGQTEKGDLFALGVILYECLTGAMPFPGSSPSAILERTLAAPIRSFGELKCEVPAELASLVMGLLERDPERRSPSSAEVVADTLGKLAVRNDWRWSPEIPERFTFSALPVRTFSVLLSRAEIGRSARGGVA